VLFMVAAPYKAEKVSDEFFLRFLEANMSDEISSEALEQNGVMTNEM